MPCTHIYIYLFVALTHFYSLHATVVVFVFAVVFVSYFSRFVCAAASVVLVVVVAELLIFRLNAVRNS